MPQGVQVQVLSRAPEPIFWFYAARCTRSACAFPPRTRLKTIRVKRFPEGALMSLGGVHGADLAGLEELHDSIALVRLPSGCTRERTERLFSRNLPSRPPSVSKASAKRVPNRVHQFSRCSNNSEKYSSALRIVPRTKPLSI